MQKKEGRSDVIIVDYDDEVHKTVSFRDSYLPVWFPKAHYFIRSYRKRTNIYLQMQMLNQYLSRQYEKNHQHGGGVLLCVILQKLNEKL